MEVYLCLGWDMLFIPQSACQCAAIYCWCWEHVKVHQQVPHSDSLFKMGPQYRQVDTAQTGKETSYPPVLMSGVRGSMLQDELQRRMSDPKRHQVVAPHST